MALLMVVMVTLTRNQKPNICPDGAQWRWSLWGRWIIHYWQWTSQMWCRVYIQDLWQSMNWILKTAYEGAHFSMRTTWRARSLTARRALGSRWAPGWQAPWTSVREKSSKRGLQGKLRFFFRFPLWINEVLVLNLFNSNSRKQGIVKIYF